MSCDQCGWVDWLAILISFAFAGILVVSALLVAPHIGSALGRFMIRWGVGLYGAILFFTSSLQLWRALRNRGHKTG